MKRRKQKKKGGFICFFGGKRTWYVKPRVKKGKKKRGKHSNPSLYCLTHLWEGKKGKERGGKGSEVVNGHEGGKGLPPFFAIPFKGGGGERKRKQNENHNMRGKGGGRFATLFPTFIGGGKGGKKKGVAMAQGSGGGEKKKKKKGEFLLYILIL